MRSLLKSIRGTKSDSPRPRFWERFSIEELNSSEWESLCDNCGKCCLLKFTPDGDKKVKVTRVACRLLDLDLCRCGHYEARTRIVPDCIVLNPETVDRIIDWMPDTCAYRLLREGRPLYPWHHLISGSTKTVHEAEVSVRGKAISETEVDISNLDDYAIEES